MVGETEVRSSQSSGYEDIGVNIVWVCAYEAVDEVKGAMKAGRHVRGGEKHQLQPRAPTYTHNSHRGHRKQKVSRFQRKRIQGRQEHGTCCFRGEIHPGNRCLMKQAV